MDVYGAVADPTRRRIIELLAGGSMDAGSIVLHFDVSQPAVSRHLRVLREAGMVTVDRRGTRRLYTLRRDGMDELERWVDRYRDFWNGRLDELERVAGEEP